MDIVKRISNQNLKIRNSTDKKKIIEGYFIVFNEEIDLGEGYFEKISSKALGDLSKKDIRALINHNTDLVLARTINSTLKFKIDEKGLFGRIIINEKDTDAVNIYERVKRGDVSQCSFGFNIKDYIQKIKKDGSICTELTDIELYEVSVVTFPAYEQTNINARTKMKMDKCKTLALKKEKLKEILKNV